MNNIKFSMILATRGRYELLQKLIDSYFGLAANPETVEMVFGYDSDDPQTKQVLIKNKLKYNNIVAFEVPMDNSRVEQGINLHNLYINPAARIACGKYLWVGNNDVEVITKNWDKILEEKIENYLIDKPDRLAYIFVNHDEYVTPIEWCSFPIQTREVVECLGEFFPDSIYNWGADKWQWVVIKNIINNRILNLQHDVSIVHQSYHCGKYHQGKPVEEFKELPNQLEGDEISKRFKEVKSTLSNQEVMERINKLNNYLMEKNK